METKADRTGERIELGGPGGREVEALSHDWDRTLCLARIRCLQRAEVIQRALDIDTENIDAYLWRLRELGLTKEEASYLVTEMNRLARESETATPVDRSRVDKLLRKLVRLLPTESAWNFAEPHLEDRRKSRREWAYVALRHEKRPVSGTSAARLASVFAETGDLETLDFITRSPECVQAIGAESLLAKLSANEQDYLRARVLQVLLAYDRDAAVVLSRQYPWEFAYAAGRTGDKSLVHAVCSLFEAKKEDGKFLSIYAWALGKLGASAELEILARHVSRLTRA